MGNRLRVLVVAFSIITASGGFLLGIHQSDNHFSLLESHIQQLEERLQTSETQITDLVHVDQDIIATLTSESASFAETLLEQQKERDHASSSLASTLTALSDAVSAQSSVLTAVTEQDSARIVEQWKPYVYQVACTFKLKNNKSITTRGSGVITAGSSGRWLITNAHVALEDAIYPEDCTLRQFDTEKRIALDGKDFIVDDTKDIARIRVIDDAPAFLVTQFCTATPAIGDRVIILGYPKIGGSQSITATEGIISGFDKDYYTSSAKIENGNSGGAAVDIRRNCFLGLPTLVIAGSIESLARILPVDASLY